MCQNVTFGAMRTTLGLLAALLVGCHQQAALLPIPPDIGTGASAGTPTAGPYVPAGHVLSVRLHDDIGSMVSAPGQRFSAEVLAPVTATNGTLLVPAGAVVRGHVVGVDPADNPAVRIDFDSIETVHGPVVLHASVRDLQRFPHAEAFRVYDATVTGYDAVLFSTFGGDQPARIGGGPWPTVAGPPGGPRNRVFVAAGATLDLVLSEALLGR